MVVVRFLTLGRKVTEEQGEVSRMSHMGTDLSWRYQYKPMFRII